MKRKVSKVRLQKIKENGPKKVVCRQVHASPTSSTLAFEIADAGGIGGWYSSRTGGGCRWRRWTAGSQRFPHYCIDSSLYVLTKTTCIARRLNAFR
jgi:hypothetical protein